MELEELKSVWQSVKPKIGQQPDGKIADRAIRHRRDVKSRLSSRFLFDGIFTVICLILMSTSRLWSPMKLPGWWLIAFCAMILLGALAIGRMYLFVRKINLWEDTNSEIITSVIRIKKFYRNVELATTIAVIPLLLWLSVTPLFINSWRMFFVWVLTVGAFTLEYMWYRKNIRYLDRLNH